MSLIATDIKFAYGPRFSLEGAALHASTGEFVGLIGANGSGKTTLLKIAVGLLTPEAGHVTLDGQLLHAMPSEQRARHVAFVPQGYRPVFEFTVEQAVLLGRIPYRTAYSGFETEVDVAAANEAIALMDLMRLRHESVTRLSGGELQRVMIARALAQQTPTLVLDEPNSHLDIAHQQSVLVTIRRLVEQRGLCVVASIHDLNLASIFCDSIATMRNGRTLGQGAPAQILTREMLNETFGADLNIEPNAYGDAPAIHYQYRPQEVRNEG